MSQLISPYCGNLIDLTISGKEAEAAFARARECRSLQLTERQLCDLEMLASGAFSPLEGFMNQADYQSTLDDLRLSSGAVFPIPITLPVENAENFQTGEEIVLRDAHNEIIALLDIAEIYEWNKDEFAAKIFGTRDTRHPLAAEINRWGNFNLAGKLKVLQLPKRLDFRQLRLTPAQTREKLSRMNFSNVVAFQTRNPLHRAHEAMIKKALEQTNGALLLHPAVGLTKPGDVDYLTRVRTYRLIIENHFPHDRTLLALAPLAMRFAGPREAVWHAIIRRNYGANHFIVGRDHASPGVDSNGNPFYSPSAAQELAETYAPEIGVKILKYGEFVYLADENRYAELSEIERDRKIFALSGTQVREDYLKPGKFLPDWFTHSEIAEILRESSPPGHQRGVCLWFTGLSGAGKSTTAEILETLLLEKGRRVTMLDGDVVRTNLSKGLSFSPEDRDINIRRIGFVASEIVKHGGIAVCAAISPYRATRDDIRNLIGDEQFIEIFVETSLEICEKRDVKGMYSQARSGIIKDFTGVNAPYEIPLNAEIILDTVKFSAAENAAQILEYLIERGFVRKH